MPGAVIRMLFALWFVLSIGEPSVLGFCPEHSAAAVRAAHATHMAPMSMPGGHGAAPRGTPHAHRHDAGGTPSGHHHGHCCCMTCCVGCSSRALHAAPIVIDAPAILAASACVSPTFDVAPYSDPPHLRPPGTGPPRV